jgi:hypothetical protein
MMVTTNQFSNNILVEKSFKKVKGASSFESDTIFLIVFLKKGCGTGRELAELAEVLAEKWRKCWQRNGESAGREMAEEGRCPC